MRRAQYRGTGEEDSVRDSEQEFTIGLGFTMCSGKGFTEQGFLWIGGIVK